MEETPDFKHNRFLRLSARPSVPIPIPAEFTAICQECGVSPETVLKGLIADLCELERQADPEFNNHGSDERLAAQAWFWRVMWGGRC